MPLNEIQTASPGTPQALSCFAEAGHFVEPGVRETVAHVPAPMLRVVGYHRGWWNAEGKTPATAAGSPYWFAAMALLGGRAVGGQDTTLLPAMIAMELFHDAAVLQDDVTDNDAVRYGSTAAWKLFGISQTLTVATALQALAGHVLLGLEPGIALDSTRLLDRALRTAVEGQIWDIAQTSRVDTPLELCVAMSQQKTGALVACASSLGALLGGGSPAQVSALHEYGWWCGLAGQVFNDLEDIWGTTGVFGRHKSDLRSRKITVPVAAAFHAGPSASRTRLLELYRNERDLTDAEALEAARLIDEGGGRRAAIDLRDQAVERARGSLHTLPPSRARTQLEELADVATRG